MVSFVCHPDNDLYQVVEASGITARRYDTPEAAIKAAMPRSGMLILADEYPSQGPGVSSSMLETIEAKHLRLYIEYPAALPGLEFGKPFRGHFERLVLNSNFASPLPQLHIFAANGLYWLPVTAHHPYVVAARVAGLDSAIFGLPEKRAPILIKCKVAKGSMLTEDSGENGATSALVSTTRLSHFVTGRFAPKEAWKHLWQAIIRWVAGQENLPELHWVATVGPAYLPSEPLPKDAEEQSLRRGVEWFVNARLLVSPAHKRRSDGTVIHPDSIIETSRESRVADGSLGIMEAILSTIHQDGSQAVSTALRGDCTCESAMALAFGGKMLGDASKSAIARNLLDFWFFTSDACGRERGDPNHGAYGLIAWGVGSPAWYIANYGDDNARVLLGTMAASVLMGEDRWDEKMMRCLLANLRTTGRLGFRGDRIDIPELTRNGWKYFFNRDTVNLAPHFEAYLWACYLWAYHQTGFRLFYDRAELGIRLTMAKYTDGWRWTNGLAQEKARILLPLAWLVRVEDTEVHRRWLQEALQGLMALQQPCGAIQEELGLPGKGMFPPPESNDTYGINEASLIQRNGDPITDLLYTANFAFLGLHEAATVTGDVRVRDAEDRLAQFLCRIQIQSKAHPELDGGWYRAFDARRWEAWGSNADAGWGAWAIESGWTQGWITSVLAMRRMHTTLWDLSTKSRIGRYFEQYRNVMLPE